MVPLLLLALALGTAQLAACGGGGGAPPPDTEEPPVDPPTEPPVDPPTEWPPLDPLAATRHVSTDHLATSPACAVCHDNADTANAMRDDADRPIAPMDLWRASAMANSTRDPYWRAVVSAEVATNPTHAAEIQNTCTRCHAPMAHERVGAAGGALDMSFLEADDDNAQLGLDGVSCAACHQITDEGLGSDDSYTGGFVLGSNRLIYGGHANPNPRPMQNNSGFTPVYSAHMGSSALCATCHTLETESLDADGTVNGHVLVEQGTYLEWRNSAFNDEGATPGPEAASCVDCHMPSTDQDGGAIATQLAH
ncbi:MAG: multiheme c-type cytochrome, partial [Planctomycetota bacterium]|nr:multiheme c-type cytochrome [Planctomycetota bacterium]